MTSFHSDCGRTHSFLLVYQKADILGIIYTVVKIEACEIINHFHHIFQKQTE